MANRQNTPEKANDGIHQQAYTYLDGLLPTASGPAVIKTEVLNLIGPLRIQRKIHADGTSLLKVTGSVGLEWLGMENEPISISNQNGSTVLLEGHNQPRKVDFELLMDPRGNRIFFLRTGNGSPVSFLPNQWEKRQVILRETILNLILGETHEKPIWSPQGEKRLAGTAVNPPAPGSRKNTSEDNLHAQLRFATQKIPEAALKQVLPNLSEKTTSGYNDNSGQQRQGGGHWRSTKRTKTHNLRI